MTVNNQFMWDFTVNCNCCGGICLRTRTSTHTGDTNIISNNWSNNFKFRQFRLHVPSCREITNSTTRTITIGLLNLVIVHIKVSCTGRSTNTNSIYTICIFKYSQFMVRISWTISVRCIVSINRTLRITIKNSELPEVTSTSDTEDCRSQDRIIGWIGYKLWSKVSLTKIQTNNRSTTRHNGTTLYRVVLVEIVITIIKIIITLIRQLIQVTNYTISITKSCLTIIIDYVITWSVINFMSTRV